MLYPQSNRYRWVTNLNGIWSFSAVNDSYCAATPLQGGGLTAVPASVNELVVENKKLFFEIVNSIAA